MTGYLPFVECESDCVGKGFRTVWLPRQALRMVSLVTTLIVLGLGAGLLRLTTPRIVRRQYLRWAARRVLTSLGVQVVLDDRRPHAGKGAGLVISNHVSLLDIPAVATVVPSRFVAKAEVVNWPVVGPLCAMFGVIAIERRSLKQLPGVVANMRGALETDDAVCAFPEGTTWCGTHHGRFRNAMFQAAVDTGMPILPMQISYRADGRPTTVASFIGDDGLGEVLWRVAGVREMTVVVTVHEWEIPAQVGADRGEVARHCSDVVFGPTAQPLRAVPDLIPEPVPAPTSLSA